MTEEEEAQQPAGQTLEDLYAELAELEDMLQREQQVQREREQAAVEMQRAVERQEQDEYRRLLRENEEQIRRWQMNPWDYATELGLWGD